MGCVRYIKPIDMVWFLYLMTYKQTWVIQCQSYPCKR